MAAEPGKRSGSGPPSVPWESGADDLAARLSELARDLQRQDDADHTMETIVRAAVDVIPGVDAASISVVLGRRRVESHAATGDLPRAVDAIQMEVGQGPCLDAVYDQCTVSVPDVAADDRWPRFSRRAAGAGAGSMLSFQLYVEGDNLGALNLYAHKPRSFDEESAHVGLLFAAHAAVAYAGAQRQEQLRAGMTSRDLIGQAKGILMERHKVTGDQAFRLLVRASQDKNRRLHEIAEELVERGQSSAFRAGQPRTR
ncbi:MAG TPA: GAF and ANTAR domain-containing protein [Acidothermaceae bacterium]|nr:GAF and ANTAR domain-containing protein [Acidothermaceae bacterium]